MDQKRTIPFANKEYLELSYVAKGSNYYLDPNKRVGRPAPIIVDAEIIINALEILDKKTRAFHSVIFDSNNWNGFYLFQGGVVEVHRRDAYPGYADYISFLHEDHVGLAYLVTQLELPQDGERIPGWNPESAPVSE